MCACGGGGAIATAHGSMRLIHTAVRLQVLRDRRAFYAALDRSGIPTPVRVECSRDGLRQPVVVEEEDAIVIDGVRIAKPFVEKPVDADSHDIWCAPRD